MATRFKRAGIGLAILLVGIEVTWVVGANWALSSGFVGHKINRRPEKLLIEWSQARTLFPGWITTRDLTIRGQTQGQQWYVALDRARIHMSLLDLARKTFRTYSVESSNLDVRIRRRRTEPGSVLPDEEFYPPIPGLAIDAPAPEPRKTLARRPWRLVLDNLQIEEVDQIWVLTDRLTGHGTIRADLELRLRGDTTLRNAVAHLHEVELFSRIESIASNVTLVIDGAIAPFRPREAKGWKVMDLVTATVSLQGRATGAGLLNQLFFQFPAVSFGSSGGQLELMLAFDKGQMEDGSHLELAANDGWIDIMDWRAQAPMDLRFEVDRTEVGVASTLTVGMRNASLAEPESDQPLLEGAHLDVRAAAERADLSDGIMGLARSVQTVTVDLADARIYDISGFPIPSLRGFSIDSGRVLVNSRAVFSRGASEAVLEVHGTGITASYGETKMSGDLSLDLNLTSPDPASREFDFSSSSLKIENVMSADDPRGESGWYLHLDLPKGSMRLADPGEIAGTVTLRMRDSGPLIAIFGQGKGLIQRLEGLLKFKNLEGEADLRLAANTLEVSRLEIAAEGLKVRARVRIADNKPSGILFTKFHGVPLAIDMRGEKRDLVFLRPKHWYERQTVPWTPARPSPVGQD